MRRTLEEDESTDSECDFKISPQVYKKVKREESDQKLALVKPKEEMSLIDIINDRHSGLIAPSEIEKRKIKLE